MEEVCGKSIPQLEQGCKRLSASEVCSPKEEQAHRRSGVACIWTLGNSEGRTPPLPTQGSWKMEIGKEGKGLIVPSNTKADVVDVLIKIIIVPTHRNPIPIFRG